MGTLLFSTVPTLFNLLLQIFSYFFMHEDSTKMFSIFYVFAPFEVKVSFKVRLSQLDAKLRLKY